LFCAVSNRSCKTKLEQIVEYYTQYCSGSDTQALSNMVTLGPDFAAMVEVRAIAAVAFVNQRTEQ
jgi:hypothetical protein